MERFGLKKMLKPFIKWVGGKSQIIHDIEQYVPREINTYYEPFLGGGSVLIYLLQTNRTIHSIQASDANAELINCYQMIQKSPDTLIQLLQTLQDDYTNCPDYKAEKREKIPILSTYEESLKSKTHLYYFIRSEYNRLKRDGGRETAVERAGYFIFLNKTCFRGVYRESRNGFNVPFGNYKTVNLFQPDNIMGLSALFQKVSFHCRDFGDISINDLKEGDFMYFDPPYYPLDERSFTRYTRADFDLQKHQQLATFINEAGRRISFLMSNSDTPWVRDNYREWTIRDIICKRSIHCYNPSSTAQELFITNNC